MIVVQKLLRLQLLYWLSPGRVPWPLLFRHGRTGSGVVQLVGRGVGGLVFCHNPLDVPPIPQDVHGRQQEEHSADDFHKAGREQGVLQGTELDGMAITFVATKWAQAVHLRHREWS